MAFPFERSSVEIRSAVSADLPSIAKLHAASWRAAYRGILSDEFLDGDLEADRLQSWMGVVDRLAPKDRLLIATHDLMGVLGFVSGWASREMGCEQEFDLYIDNLHVRPDMRGRKLGVALMHKLAQMSDSEERVKAYLWVLDGNEAARRFYHRLGGRACERRDIELGGVVVGETRIAWTDFRTLRVRP
jgi:ribosomal protein S18 acetylase RimI-like enzyme